MFGVLISYLPNFNVGHGNGIGNANGSWITNQHLQRSTKATLTKCLAPIHVEEKYAFEVKLHHFAVRWYIVNRTS